MLSEFILFVIFYIFSFFDNTLDALSGSIFYYFYGIAGTLACSIYVTEKVHYTYT